MQLKLPVSYVLCPMVLLSHVPDKESNCDGNNVRNNQLMTASENNKQFAEIGDGHMTDEIWIKQKYFRILASFFTIPN